MITWWILYSSCAVFSGNSYLVILLSFLFWDYVKRLDIAYLNYILVFYCWWLVIKNIFDIIDFIWDLLFFVLTLILSPLDLVFELLFPKGILKYEWWMSIFVMIIGCILPVLGGVRWGVGMLISFLSYMLDKHLYIRFIGII